MNKALKRRMSIYYSRLFYSVYLLYQLKSEPENVRLRYCSFATLTTYEITLQEQRYQIVRTGILHSNNSIQKELERLIVAIKELTSGLMKVSVGDIFRVFREGHEENYFIDSVGLKKLETFD